MGGGRLKGRRCEKRLHVGGGRLPRRGTRCLKRARPPGSVRPRRASGRSRPSAPRPPAIPMPAHPSTLRTRPPWTAPSPRRARSSIRRRGRASPPPLPPLRAAGALGRPPLLALGSGGGYPGLPLGLALPAGRLALVESVAKKARFLDVAGRAAAAAPGAAGGEAPTGEALATRAAGPAAAPAPRG